MMHAHIPGIYYIYSQVSVYIRPCTRRIPCMSSTHTVRTIWIWLKNECGLYIIYQPSHIARATPDRPDCRIHIIKDPAYAATNYDDNNYN